MSNSPSEFLVRGHDGFTRSLVQAAQKQPGKVLRCSVDGGYGQVYNFMNFDRVVLVSGGSGAAFTFAIATSMVRECAMMNVAKPIDFIWVVRYTGWFLPLTPDAPRSLTVD